MKFIVVSFHLFVEDLDPTDSSYCYAGVFNDITIFKCIKSYMTFYLWDTKYSLEIYSFGNGNIFYVQ